MKHEKQIVSVYHPISTIRRKVDVPIFLYTPKSIHGIPAVVVAFWKKAGFWYIPNGEWELSALKGSRYTHWGEVPQEMLQCP